MNKVLGREDPAWVMGVKDMVHVMSVSDVDVYTELCNMNAFSEHSHGTLVMPNPRRFRSTALAATFLASIGPSEHIVISTFRISARSA